MTETPGPRRYGGGVSRTLMMWFATQPPRLVTLDDVVSALNTQDPDNQYTRAGITSALHRMKTDFPDQLTVKGRGVYFWQPSPGQPSMNPAAPSGPHTAAPVPAAPLHPVVRPATAKIPLTVVVGEQLTLEVIARRPSNVLVRDNANGGKLYLLTEYKW